MKRLYAILVCLSSFASLSAQTYGNEWITYSQKYLKIKITTTGIYRIDSTTLANGIAATGNSLSTIDPHNFQVFHNGKEEYIWVEGEADNVFNNGDYIEFYGKRNDGAMDSTLYGGASSQLNPYYSLFNDTATYFLTWNSSAGNRRFTDPNDTTFSQFTPSPYFTNEEIYSGNGEYLPGIENSIGLSDPDYIPSEGYYSGTFYYGNTASYTLNTNNAYTGGPNASVSFKIGSHSNDWNLANDNTIELTYPGGVFDTTYDGYAVWKKDFTGIAPSLFSSSFNFTVQSINAVGSVSSGRTGTAYIDLKYPHTFNMENRVLFRGFLPDEISQSKSLLPLQSVGGSGQVYVYDLFHDDRIQAVFNAGTWNALVANGNGTEKEFIVAAQSGIMSVSSLTPVNTNGSFTDFASTPLDSAYIIVTCKKLWNAADQYRVYRSGIGGNHQVVLADIAELYDQFSWGIDGDPLSIRNFCNYLISVYPTVPKDLLLIGKSFSPEIPRNSTYYFPMSLVPTFGYPPCDNNFTAGLNGTGWEPAIPTGRIAAQDSASVMWYLNKVMQYESNAPAEWMKYVLHFGGGSDANEQSMYAGYLNSFADTITDTLFGGHVLTYLKTTNAPIQINQSDSLRHRIEDGVSIMTFFGHASGTGFDQSIDDVSTYNNAGKYPLVIANSCYAGNIHDVIPSSSEVFTLIDQKGTIGYIATVGLGIPGYLNEYSGRLYQSIGKINYGRPIGESIKWTVASAQAQLGNDIYLKATLKEMTFQGDPAVVINSFPKPDYEITNSDVWFDQDSDPDSVIVYAKITNLGRAIDTTFTVQLRRYFPNGDSATIFQLVHAPAFCDTIRISLPIDQQRGIGLNRISIMIDYFGLIPEMREDNNSTFPDIDLLIHGSGILPVYPYDFAVIPSDTVTLKASTVNPLEPMRQYRFELDTTDLFNSPFKQSYVVNAPGGVVSWHPNLLTFSPTTDSVVYFWRVSPDSLTSGDVFIWRQTSFQSIPNEVGWGQDHIYQFTNDGYQYVQLDRSTRQFNFVNTVNNISVKDGIYGSACQWNEVWYKINQSTQHIFSCTSGFGGEGFSVVAINPVSVIPWNYHDTYVGQESSGYWDCVGANQQLNAFDFFDTDVQNQLLAAHFIDSIPAGYHVLVYSQDYSWYSRIAYDPALQAAFAGFGCDTIGTSLVPPGSAFIAWGTQGAANSATEVVGATPYSVITLNDTMNSNWNSGFVSSPLIGPAANWGSFHWKQHTAEIPDYDSVYVEMWGFNNANGLNGTLITTFDETTTDVLNLNSIVDATTYPYIKLYAKMKDDTAHTPAQLDRWHVLYTPVPDLAVNPPLAFSFYSDTLQEGDNAKMIVAVQNLTPWDFSDSMLYTYWIVDANRNTHALPSRIKVTPLLGNTWITDTIQFSTTNYPGANELWMEVNPINTPATQLEEYHFNNVIMVPFNVSADKVNPLLDVTFDGQHIMNGDIVSGKPD
ncbi:MAG TPA: C25 family cysteine peptidase, partial [Bacteroidia bacterium]|nr:C25 family cysteine peptidase [Bacteroidia bacterium]